MRITKKVLVVEHDPDVSLGYRILLRPHHHDTILAADASAAMHEARMHLADLMILGLGAGDGFLVLEQVRAGAALSTIPVIVMPARDGRGNKEKVLEAGARAFVQNPGTTLTFVAHRPPGRQIRA